MMGTAAVAAVVNLISLRMLQRLKNKDVNLQAATTFSFNDFVANEASSLQALSFC